MPGRRSVDRDAQIRRLRTLVEASRTLTSELDVQDLLHEILRSAIRLVPAAEAGVLLLYDSQRGQLAVHHAIGFTPGVYEVVLDPGESMSGRVFLERQPLMCATPEEAREAMGTASELTLQRFADATGGAQYPQSALCAPLVYKGEALGAMVLETYRVPRAFEPFDLDLFDALAQHAAIGIAHARLYDTERQARFRIEALHAELQRERDELSHRLDAHDALGEIVRDGLPLSALAGRVARATQGTVVLLDALYRVRAAEPAVEAEHAQDLHLAGWTELRTVLRDAARTRAQQAAMINKAGGRHLLVSPAVGGGEVLGFAVQVGERPPALVERSTLESAGLIAATELLRERAREEGEIRRRAEILDLLLSGQVPGPGHPLHGLQPPLVVGLGELAAGEDGAGPRLFRALVATVQQEVERLRPQATVTVKGRHAVVLWGPVDGRGPRRLASTLDAAGQSLQRVTGGAGAQFAVSELVESLSDLAGVYEEGRLALEIRRETGRTERVTLVGDLGAYRLIARAASGPEALELARRVLGPIEEHDRERGRGLLTTLRAYLAEGGSVRAAATQLGVHPHTVQYRLDRVQDLTGLRLSRPEDRMTLDLALRIHGVATRVLDT
jgi:hypothetical protein